LTNEKISITLDAVSYGRIAVTIIHVDAAQPERGWMGISLVLQEGSYSEDTVALVDEATNGVAGLQGETRLVLIYESGDHPQPMLTAIRALQVVYPDVVFTTDSTSIVEAIGSGAPITLL